MLNTRNAAVAALLVLFIVGFVYPSKGAQPTAPPKGFVDLFNGENLQGWWGLKTENPAKWMGLSAEDFAKKKKNSIDNPKEGIKKHWTAKDGVLVNDGGGYYLTTDKMYGDFELLLEYKTVAKADSGIYLRGVPQVQIWDYTKEGGKWKMGADKGSGGLWNNSKGSPGKNPSVLADKPFGQWNSFRILMVGERVTIFLNDKLIVDHARLENYFDRKGNMPATGPIQLQTHGGEIQWRNLFIREIGPDEANKVLADGGLGKKARAGFNLIFNGKDFDGWGGPVQNYQVQDGTVMCKPGKGGTIYTKKEYADFIVQMEIKLPAGGNNGLAIRYPGSGDTAYVGMCELQVLDDTSKKYATLDPRQYHGSVYGVVAARRGHQRPVGQWNYQEVTVKGSTIKVELNGYVIVDADVSKVKNFMGGKPHKGITRKTGYFGFAGHGAAVQFRNIRIKTLK